MKQKKIYIELISHIKRYITLEESEYEQICSYFKFHSFKKKEFIHDTQNNNLNIFVLKGCLQMFSISDNGIQRTLQFAIENWWISDCLAFINASRSDFYIQTIEPTQFLSISLDKQNQLLQNFPKLEKYFRIIYQISYGSSLMKMKYLYDFSKEDRYFHFTEKYPDFVKRIPQYLLASYLGLTPEYVSEIRKKRSS